MSLETSFGSVFPLSLAVWASIRLFLLPLDRTFILSFLQEAVVSGRSFAILSTIVAVGSHSDAWFPHL